MSLVFWILSQPGAALPWLAWFFLTPFALACGFLTPKKVIAAGGIFGFISWIISIWWLIYPLLNLTKPHGWFYGPTLIALLAALNAISWLIFTWIFVYKKWITKNTGIIFAAATFALMHYYLNFIFPGNYALSQFRQLPLIQVLDLGGEPLLIFLMSLTGFGIANFLYSLILSHNKNWAALALALTSILFVLAYGETRLLSLNKQLEVSNQLTVGVLQLNSFSNTPEAEPMKKPLLLTQKLVAQAKQNNLSLDLVVWPELPQDFVLTNSRHEIFLRHLLQITQSPIVVVGRSKYIAAPDINQIYFYSLGYLLGYPYQVLLQQEKMHLIPFAEYLPYEKKYPILKAIFSSKTYSAMPGSTTAIYSLNQNVRVAILICYDILFDDSIRKALKQNANLIINPADDAWFGKTLAPNYSFADVVFQAIKYRVPIVRNANTGISGIILPTGKIAQDTPIFQSAMFLDTISIKTFDSFYKKYPFAVPLLLLLIALYGIFIK